MNDLESYGLARVGRWVLSGHASVKHLRSRCPTGINFEIPQEWRKSRNVVYVFVVANEIRYIGETTAGMASRFVGYRYGNPLVGDTDNRVKLAITDALVDKREVQIWACRPVGQFQLAGGDVLEIPASKPLEEHLIARFKPDLNVKNLVRGDL